MSEYTKGPWKINFDPDYENTDAYYSVKSGDFFIASIYQSACQGDDPAKEVQANARLIAAAPELLEALEAIIHAADDIDIPYAQLSSHLSSPAKAAIAKAKGES